MTDSPLRLRLDGAALVSNWRHLQRLSGAAACGAAVKANGYGLGAHGVVERLAAAGCRDFFVASWAEARAIADLGGSFIVAAGQLPELGPENLLLAAEGGLIRATAVTSEKGIESDDLAELEKVLRRLDELAAEVPTDAPWSAPHAAEWDAITAGSWYDAQGLSPVARELLEICTVGILAVPTVEVSFLHLLFTIQTCGVTSELFAESEGGAQTTRFVGGTAEIPKRLAALIEEHIVLGAPVQLIEHGTEGVTVHCRGGLVARGRRVIVAISPTLAGRIMYDPPLPGTRDLLTQRLPNASAMKAFFVYDEPFWRADGLNGQVISDVGPARMSNDTCMPDNDHGVILMFLEGEQARTFGRLPQADRRDLLAAELVRHFGARAARPELYSRMSHGMMVRPQSCQQCCQQHVWQRLACLGPLLPWAALPTPALELTEEPGLLLPVSR